MAFTLSLTDAQALLDFITGRAAARGSTTRTLYGALCTAQPTGTTAAALLASELAVAGYARQAFTWSAPSSSGSPSETHNTGTMTWGPFTADPASVGWLVLVDSSSGTAGEVVGYFTLDAAKDAASGESIQAAASAFQLTDPYQT